MSSSSLLAEVQSLNHQIREQNTKIYGLLQSVLRDKNPIVDRSLNHLQQSLNRQKQQIKKHNRLSESWILKNSSVSSVHIKQLKTRQSHSTNRCQSYTKIHSRREEQSRRVNKPRCFSSQKSQKSLKSLKIKEYRVVTSISKDHQNHKLKKLSAKRFQQPKFPRYLWPKAKIQGSMLRI